MKALPPSLAQSPTARPPSSGSGVSAWDGGGAASASAAAAGGIFAPFAPSPVRPSKRASRTMGGRLRPLPAARRHRAHAAMARNEGHDDDGLFSTRTGRRRERAKDGRRIMMGEWASRAPFGRWKADRQSGGAIHAALRHKARADVEGAPDHACVRVRLRHRPHERKRES